MDYGETWRKIRKLVHQYFMEAMCEERHIHVQHGEAIQMLRDFMVDPGNHMVHPKRYNNSMGGNGTKSRLPALCEGVWELNYFEVGSQERDNPEGICQGSGDFLNI